MQWGCSAAPTVLRWARQGAGTVQLLHLCAQGLCECSTVSWNQVSYRNTFLHVSKLGKGFFSLFSYQEKANLEGSPTSTSQELQTQVGAAATTQIPPDSELLSPAAAVSSLLQLGQWEEQSLGPWGTDGSWSRVLQLPQNMGMCLQKIQVSWR